MIHGIEYSYIDGEQRVRVGLKGVGQYTLSRKDGDHEIVVIKEGKPTRRMLMQARKHARATFR